MLFNFIIKNTKGRSENNMARLSQFPHTALYDFSTKVFSHKEKPGQNLGHGNSTFWNAGRHSLKNLCGPRIFLFVSLLRGCQYLKGTTKSPELFETKTQTSSGKFEWFCHQLLMFSCLRTYRAQNFILNCPATFSNMLFFSQGFK